MSRNLLTLGIKVKIIQISVIFLEIKAAFRIQMPHGVIHPNQVRIERKNTARLLMRHENRSDMRLVVIFSGIVVPKQVNVNPIVAESAQKHNIFKAYPIRIGARGISKNQVFN